jgi:insulysin
MFLHIVTVFLTEKFFNQLRTIEQLGYIVSCSISKIGYIEEQTYGIAFLIQSPKKLPDDLKVRIKQFIYDQYNTLEDFNDGNFKEIIKTTINYLTKNDDNIYDEFIRNLNEISMGDYMFNIKNVYKTNAFSLSLKKFKEMYYEYLINRETRKIRMVKLYCLKMLRPLV